MGLIDGTEFETEDELSQALAAELGPHKDDQITIRLVSTPVDLMGILGIMQLALRHPAPAGTPAAANLAQWARAIEMRLAEYGPATARVCAAGWSPEFDRRRDDE